MILDTLNSLRDVWLVLLGGCIAAGFGQVQARHMLYSQARLKFAAAFLPELTKLLGQDPCPDGGATLHLLETSLPRHHGAYIELWASAGRWQRRSLERRWKYYRYGDGPECPEQPFDYLVSSAYEEPGARKLAVERIQHLIS
ncbi:hypothetical protein [Delftia tsuruhatensis]|uniref:hypothetical protein n=1 Tax=Delftia tsuruhatensis TaxID=180282 RepID=UPI003A83862E